MTQRQRENMGQRIRARRENMKLTQEKAAEILDISLTHYKNIEHGRAYISLNLLMKTCERFALDQTFVLTGKTSRGNHSTGLDSNPLKEKSK